MLDINDYQPYNLYNSWDDGAPALTHEAHSVQVILKACLIEGYGSKLPAGWDMPDDDINGKGWRSFRPRGINDTGCTYRIRDDSATAFTLEAIHKDNPAPFATRRISKIMYNVGAIQPAWLLFANDESCWLMIQTDAGQPYYAVIYFGNRYATAAPYRAGSIFIGNESYQSGNYSLYEMALQDADGNSSRALRLFAGSGGYTVGAERIYYPQPFVNTSDNSVSIFLPGLMTGPGALTAPPNNPGYAITPHPAGDIINVITAWGGLNETAWALGRSL
jgi:hypothetical protein